MESVTPLIGPHVPSPVPDRGVTGKIEGSIERRRFMSREIFHGLLNIEEHPSVAGSAYSFVVGHLQRAVSFAGERCPWPEVELPVPRTAPALAEAVWSLFEHSIRSAPIAETPAADDAARHRCLLQFLPVVAIEGRLLQPLVTVAMSHSPLYPQLYDLYANQCEAACLRDTLCEWTRAKGHGLPEVASRRFADHIGFLDAAFARPAIELSLACFPQDFLPELLGVLLSRALGLSPYLAWITPLWSRHAPQPSRGPDAPGVAAAAEAIRAYLENRGGGPGTAAGWRRVLVAIRTQWRAEEALVAAVGESLHRVRNGDPRSRAAEILRAKLPYARGHHRDTRIGGRPLEAWIGAPDPDLEDLLDALAGSPFVNATEPEQSRFLTELLAVGGPMYRVFTEEEIGAILEWIRTLCAVEETVIARSPTRRPAMTPLHDEGSDARGDPTPTAAQESDRHQAMDPRRLYHELVNIDRHPEALGPALALIEASMARTRGALKGRALPIHLAPFPYTASAFDQRIESLYRAAVAAYRPFRPPPRLNREELVWLLVRLAPLILVDGSWLQCAGRLQDAHPAIARRLLDTYADEIGRGEPRWHHANIFRRLLEEQGIGLPEVTTPEFVARPEFPRLAFELPCLLLAISQYPRRFLPELLGLNLAIELSGLGAFYMRLVDEMHYWGLDPAFVTVHISSDNLASGHAALAREAVALYLDEVHSRLGDEERQHQWQRVWTGFASLTIVPQRAWRALAWRFAARFATARLRIMLFHGLAWRRRPVAR